MCVCVFIPVCLLVYILYVGDLSSILDSLLDILLLHPHMHKQIIWMINHVVAGAAGLGRLFSEVPNRKLVKGTSLDFE